MGWKNNQLRRLQADCSKIPECKSLFDATINAGLQYLETQYGMASKIQKGSKIDNVHQELYEQKRKAFADAKSSLIDFCARNKILIPSFNVDDIFGMIAQSPTI